MAAQPADDSNIRAAKRKAVLQVTSATRSLAAAYPATNNSVYDDATRTRFVALNSVCAYLVNEEGLVSSVFDFIGREKTRRLDSSAASATKEGVEKLTNATCIEMCDTAFWITFRFSLHTLIAIEAVAS